MPLRVWGDWENEAKTGHDIDYYRARDTRLDCRGDLRISPEANIAHEVHIITAGHSPEPGHFGQVRVYPVHIEAGAFIGSCSILFNCRIGAGAIVRPGTVVLGRIVRPHTMVEGNPAMCIAYRLQGKWISHDEPHALKRMPKWDGKTL